MDKKPTDKKKRSSILLVDDEKNIVESLKRVLRDDGLDIRTALSGDEGLRAMEDLPADIVVSDLRMPRLDGAEFLKAVREKWPRSVRILLTGYADVKAISGAVNEGEVFRFITKPWDDEEFRRLIHSALRRKNAETEGDWLRLNLLARISDEIREPVGVLLGISKFLEALRLSPPEIKALETLRNTSQSLLKVVDDLKEFSEIGMDEMETEIMDFDLRTLVEDCLELFAAQAQSKGLELACSIPSEISGHLRGDAAHIRQALLCLIQNAVQYTTFGHVIVAAEKRGEIGTEVLLRISIEDTGPGISKNVLPFLFKPAPDCENKERVGLGLFVAKKIMEFLKGGVGYETEEGKGSSFWMESTVTRPTATAPNIWEGRLPKKVLIVDSNPVVRDILAEVLRSVGVEAAEARTAGDATALIGLESERLSTYDALLTADQLFDGDGLTLAARLRRSGALAESARIFLMTTLSRPVEPQNLADAGIDGVLTKPVRRAFLLEKLSKSNREKKTSVL